MTQDRLNNWSLPNCFNKTTLFFISLSFSVLVILGLALQPLTANAALDEGDGVLFFAKDNDDNIQFDSWNGSSLTGTLKEGEVVTGGADFRFVRTVISPTNPTESHVMFRSLTTDNIYVQTCTSGDCDATGDYDGPTEGTGWSANSTTTGTIRPFDIAYEETTGHALAVYQDIDDNDTEFCWRTWDGASWSSPTCTLNPSSTDDDIRFARLRPRPGTDDIALVWSDNDREVSGMIWDGSSWGNEKSSGSCSLPADNVFDFDAAWEADGDTLMVACGETSASAVDWFTYDATGPTWYTPSSGGSNGGTISSFAGDMEHIRLFGSPYDNHIGFVGSLVSTAGADIQGAMWNGSSWTKSSAFTSTGRGVAGSFPADGAFIDADTALFAFGETGSDWIKYVVWEDGSGFGSVQTKSGGSFTTTNHWDTTRVYSPINSNQAIIIGIDASNDVHVFSASSCTTTGCSTWDAEGEVTTTAPDSVYSMVDFAFYYNPNSATIDISGTALQSNFFTPISTGVTIRAKVNGAGDYSTTAAGDGTFTISSVPVTAGNTITLYIDGDATYNGNTIFTTQATNETSMNIVQNVVAIMSTDGANVANSNLDFYDSDDEGDGDLLFAVSGGDLTVTSSTLFVQSGDTFAPGGDVTVDTGNLVFYGTVTMGSNTLTIDDGDIDDLGGGTFSTSGNTVLSGNGAIKDDLTFLNLTLGDGSDGDTTTSESNFTVTGVLTVAASHTFDAADDTITLTGSSTPFVVNGTFTPNTSTIHYDYNGLNYIAATTYNNLTLESDNAIFGPTVSSGNTYTIQGDLVLTGSSTATFLDPFGGQTGVTFDVQGDVTIGSGETLAAPYGFSVGGDWINNGSFTHEGRTVTFDGSGSKTITSNGSNFRNVTISGSAVYSLTDAMTVANNLNINAGTLDPDANVLTAENLTIGGGTLLLDSSADTVKIGTSLSMTSGNLTASDLGTAPSITTDGTPGTNFYSVNFSGGTLGVDELSISSVDNSGIVIGSGVTMTNFNKITLASFEVTGGEDVMIDVTDQTKTLNTVVFPAVGSYVQGTDFNVRINDVDLSADTLTIQNASGGFDGEDYDSDNGNDTVEWGTTISLSGVLFSDAGVSAVDCEAENRTIAVSVNGATPTTETCSAGNGAFTVTGLAVEINDILTVFVDGHANDASAVVRSNTSETDMTGIDLYEGHVIVRSENATAMSIDNLAGYDSDDDADLAFTAVDSSPDTLTVSDGNTLYIWGGDTFTPGGNITVDDINIAGTFTADLSQSHTVSGSWTNSGTFNPSTSTIVLDSTASETITSGSDDFYNVLSTGSGTWTLQDDLAVTNALQLNAGTLALDDENLTIGVAAGTGSLLGDGAITHTSGTVTMQGSGFLWQSSGAYQFNNLTLGDASNTKTTTSAGTISVTGNLTVQANHTLGGNADLTVNGDMTGAGDVALTGGTFEQRVSATENFGSSSGSEDWVFNNLTFSRGSGTAIIDTDETGSGTITVTGTLKVSKTGDGAATSLFAGDRTWNLTNTGGVQKPFTLDEASGALTAETSTFVIGGSYGSGDITLEDATYYNLTIGDGTSTENFSPASTMVATNDLSVSANATLVGGVNWTVNGGVSGAGTVNLTSGTFTQRVAGAENFGSTSGSNTWTFNNLSFENSSGSPITVTVASGGSGSVVVSGDLAIGDAGDSSTTTLDVNTNDRVFDVDDDVSISSQGVLEASSSDAMTVGGTWTNSGSFTHNNGTVTFDAGSSKTISGNITGSDAFYNIVFNNASGSWSTSGYSITVDNDFTITAGTYTAPGTSWSSDILSVGGNFSNSGTFTHNNGRLELTATDTGNTVDLGGSDAHYLWFDGIGGEWLITGSDVTMDTLIIEAGTVDADVNLTNTNLLGGWLSNVGTLNITNPVTFDWRRSTGGSIGSGNFATNWTFHNFTLSNSSGSDIDLTSGWRNDSTITINGTLQVGKDTDTNATTYAFDDQTWVFAGTTPFALASSPAGSLTTGVSTVKLTGSGTVSIIDDVDYYDVEFDGSGTYRFDSGTISVARNMDITSGTVDLDTNDPLVTVGEDLTINGTLTASSDTNLNVSQNWTNNGTFNHSNGTVRIVGPSQSDIIGSSVTTFYNLLIDPDQNVRFKKDQEVGIAGAFTATADVKTRIGIISTSETSADATDQFLLNLTGSTNLSWAFVQNGGCYAGTNAVPAQSNTLNGGNNNSTCWPFSNVGVQFDFAPGDGSGGGAPVTGGGSGGGDDGGETGGTESGDGGGEAQNGGDEGGGGGSPSP